MPLIPPPCLEKWVSQVLVHSLPFRSSAGAPISCSILPHGWAPLSFICPQNNSEEGKNLSLGPTPSALWKEVEETSSCTGKRLSAALQGPTIRLGGGRGVFEPLPMQPSGLRTTSGGQRCSLVLTPFAVEGSTRQRV